MKNKLSIGQFSKKSGVTQRALRVYEELGLLVCEKRSESGYRIYDESQLERASQIKKFKHLGFTLEQIKALLISDSSLNSEKLKNLF
ncbi:MAG: MerR family transcriptional regulator, partial [Bdellovibrionales bacterium]|nr:MerR family transcriptional regulator [Bdellovibrionales bacterium]